MRDPDLENKVEHGRGCYLLLTYDLPTHAQDSVPHTQVLTSKVCAHIHKIKGTKVI